jgi:hypothetical protein
MNAILVAILMGLFGCGIWRILRKSEPVERRKCSVCGTSKRALQWLKSWEDWYCLRCKEECIHIIVDALTGEHG